jgi:hypothetical protein|nr:hypothetical protein [Candidatus Krumholzibacteria bacterium]
MRQRPGTGIALVVAILLISLASSAFAQSSNARVLRLSVPYINNFYLQPNGEPDAKVNTGFWGLGVELLVRHSHSQFLGLAASVATDFPVPVPAAVDLLGEHEFMTSYALDLTNNHTQGRFSFGYGLSYSTNQWELKYFDDLEGEPPTRDPIKLSSSSLGLAFPINYALNDRFSLGLTYRPYLYRFGTDAGFEYEHVISIEIAWNIVLP